MGVFKWLRRERAPGSMRHHRLSSSEGSSGSLSGHISNEPLRNEEYDRALAEFFARRSTDAGFSITTNREDDTEAHNAEEERTCQSLPCVEQKTESLNRERGSKSHRRHSDVTLDPNGTLLKQQFNDPQRNEEYERALDEYFARRSNDGLSTSIRQSDSFTDSVTCPNVRKTRQSLPYFKQKAELSFSGEWPLSERKVTRNRRDRFAGVPQIQFLFGNQVFMPGNASTLTTPIKTTGSNVTVDFDEGEVVPDFFNSKKSTLSFDQPPEELVKNGDEDHQRRYTPPLRDRLISESQHDLLSGSEATADDIDSGVSAAGGGPADRQLSEIIQELKNLDDWADEQLRINKSATNDVSFASVQRKFEEMCQRVNGHFRGVPIVRSSAIEGQHLEDGVSDLWCHGTWDTYRVYLHRVKRISVQTDSHLANEVDILTTLRQPNMLLLMGLCYDREQSVTLVFEECIGSLYDLIHLQGRILPAKVSLQYIKDVTNALTFLNMHGRVHTCVSSHCIMVTTSDVAKLANFAYCRPVSVSKTNETACSPFQKMDTECKKQNGGTYNSPLEYLPLLSQSESVMSLQTDNDSQNAKARSPKMEVESEEEDEKAQFVSRDRCFRWQAPELFHVGAEFYEKCDVFSVCLVLWECCKLTIPWTNLDYRKLKDLYLKYGTGINLSEVNNFPSGVLDILEEGLELDPAKRSTLKNLMVKLQTARIKMEDEEFSSFVGDTQSVSHENNQTTAFGEPAQMLFEEDLNNAINDEKKNFAITNGSSTNTQDSNMLSEDDNLPDKVERLPISLKTIERYEVTDLDDCTGNSDRTYLKYSPLKNSSPVTPRSDEVPLEMEQTTPLSHLQRTDSTEYCSLLSPDLPQKMFRMSTCNRPHLDSPIPKDIENRVSKLNQSLTPKAYTPLRIRLPSVGNLESFKRPAHTESVQKCESEAKCKFEIRNWSMPETPIARSNKLRKNAWLSGENEEVQDRFNNSVAKRRHSDVPFVSQQDECEDTSNEAKSPRLESKSATLDSDNRKKYLPIRSRTLFRQFSEDNDDAGKDEHDAIAFKSLSSRNLLKSPFKIETSVDRFRSRSQSWSCQNLNASDRGGKPSDEVLSKVNVKPLVAIHERWIEEARQHDGRSHSLPDTQRVSSNPVKPASHRLDPMAPKLMTRKQMYMSKGLNKSQNDVDMAERYSELSVELKEAVERRRDQKPKEPNFFEAALWKRERDICIDSMPKLDIQDCSTPIRGTHRAVGRAADARNIDSATNTSTYEELYERIRKEVLKTFAVKCEMGLMSQNDGENCDGNCLEKTVADDIVKCVSSSIVLNLDDLIKKRKSDDNAATEDIQNEANEENDSSKDSLLCLCSASSNKGNFLSKTAIVDDVNCDCRRDEDAVSLPEQFSFDQNDDFSHKTLKRCQAFTALQEARSTEDLYIDDELAHPDNMQTLGDNMKLIPLHGSLHEALCDKYEECCLIKIQEETDCNRVYIVCDKATKDKDAAFPAKRTISAIAEERDEDLEEYKCLASEPERLSHCPQISSESALPVIVEECETAVEPITIQNCDDCSREGDTSKAERVDESTVNVERGICILEEFVQSFERLEKLELSSEALNAKELQTLLIVEDFEDLLSCGRSNEGYAELCRSDEAETRRLIDLDDSGSTCGYDNF